MSREIVKDKRNLTIGFISDFPDKRIATHFSKGYAGYYNKTNGITFDKSGKVYAYGDATQSLIRDIESNK